MKTQRTWIVLALLIGGGLGGWLALRWHDQTRRVWAEQQEMERRRISWDGLKRQIWKEVRIFPGEAGIWVEDLDTGWVTGYQASRAFPAASVVKIPIMAACFEAAAQGTLPMDEKIALRGADKVYGSGVLKAAPNGSVYTIEQLIWLMITRSDNTATNLLIQRMGFSSLNNAFRRMGLAQTRLSRKMMDFSQRKNGVENDTTAQDISLVLEKLYHRQLVSAAVSEQCLELLKRQAINDRIPAQLPAGTVVAHKTGLERGVCHDSGIVFTQNGDYLVCVLTQSRLKTARRAKEFIARIASYTHDYKTEM